MKRRHGILACAALCAVALVTGCGQGSDSDGDGKSDLRESIEKSIADASESVKKDMEEVGGKLKEKANTAASNLKQAATEKMDEVKEKAANKAEELKAEARQKVETMAEEAKAKLKAEAKEMSDKLVQSMKDTSDELLKSLGETVQDKIAEFTTSFSGNEPAVKDGKVESAIESLGKGDDKKALEEMHQVSEQGLTADQKQKVQEFKQSITAFVVQRNFSSVNQGQSEVDRAVKAINEGRTEEGVAELEKLSTKVQLTKEQKELLLRLRP